MGGGRVSGSRVSIPVAYLGGFFYCSNNWKNSSFAKTTMESGCGHLTTIIKKNPLLGF